MGAVFLARDSVLGRRVAIKVVSGRIAGDPQSRERFLREARTLATVEHPNVVRVYAFGELDQQAYLVLEYIEGETLADRIARSGPLPVDEAMRYLRQIVDALEAACEHGIVHRDIKPANILIGRRDDVRVVDFGLAKPTLLDDGSSNLTQTGHMLGTPHYLSPEQALGKPVDFRSDIYSLGIVLYEMLTAERPFQGTTPMSIVAKSIHEPLPDIRTKRPDIPPHVVDLLEWMTRKAPEDRPSSYAALRDSIDREALTQRLPKKAAGIERPLLVVALATLFGAVLGVVLHFAAGRPSENVLSRSNAGGELVVAVAPFWGPDDLSTSEGRVMAALVERSIASRLRSDVKVAGIERTKDPVRSHDEARELGRRLGAGVVVWGEALALRDETEIQPSFTLVDLQRTPEEQSPDAPAMTEMADLEMIEIMRDREAQPLRLSSDAPDQIEMRRTSAEGVGEMVTFLAGLHNLYVKEDPKAALPFFERSTASADVLRHRAQALVRLEREEDAIEVLRRALDLDPAHSETHAQLGDLFWMRGESAPAKEHYRLAAVSGAPPETAQAIVHEGRLFARELFVNDKGKIRHSGYLLLIDPETDHVLERHFMPGEILTMRSAGDELTITWTDGGLRENYALVWKDGSFSAAICCPGGNLRRRMNGMKSGMEVGRNFLQGVSRSLDGQDAHPHYRLPEDPSKINPEKPASLEELEVFLLPAIERDPTQPWYLVHLGWVQKMTGREEEARRTWSSLVEGDWPGIPYWEFSFISRLFERLSEPAWADRTFEKALEIRAQNPQPVEWSILIERLVVAPFARLHEADLRDPERAYEWLLRARQLTGYTEGGRMASSIWKTWFERQGDSARAEHEAGFQASTWGWLDQATRLDYIMYPLLTMLIATPLLALVLMWSGWQRARHSGPPQDPGGTVAAAAITAVTLFLAAAATLVLVLDRSQEWGRVGVQLGFLLFWTVLVISHFLARMRTRSTSITSFPPAITLAAGVGGVVAAAFAGSRTLMAIAVIALGVVLILRISKLHWRDLTARISRRERMTLIAATSVVVVLLGFFSLEVARMSRVGQVSIGIVDSLGHPQQTTYLDRLLSKAESPALLYATAVGHHLAGNFERAVSLYERVEGDPRAAAGLEAARSQRIDVEVPSGVEFIDAVTTGAWRDLPVRSDVFSGELMAVIRTGTVVAILLIVVCALVISVPSARSSSSVNPGRGSKIAGALLPGLWWLRTGNISRGTTALVLLVFAALLAVVLPRTVPLVGAPGMVAFTAVPNVLTAFPMPLPEALTRDDIPELYLTAMMFSYPGARIFWSVVVIAIVSLLVLHALTIREILGARRAEDPSEARTEITPSPAEALTADAETLMKAPE